MASAIACADAHRLRDRLSSDADPADVIRWVLTDTLDAGGHDNATIALLRVEATDG